MHVNSTSTNRKRKSDRVRDALMEHWRLLSDREIALAVGVSNRTVSNHRKRLEEEGRILPRFRKYTARRGMPARGVYFGDLACST